MSSYLPAIHYNGPMVVDFHTHIFPFSFRQRRDELSRRDATFAALFANPRARMATAEELVAAMDEAEVDVSVVMGIGWTDREVGKEANDYIVESLHRFSGRLMGLCSVNPAWGEDAITEVERCAGQGVSGIGELHADSQGFDITSKEVMAPLMQAAAQQGLVVLVHSSEPVGHLYPGKGMTTPDRLSAFVKNFPENTIVCAHWGGGLPFYALMPEVGEELANVYFDTAVSPLLYTPGVFPTVVGAIGSHKVLFGSDFPLIEYRRLLKQIEEAPIADEDRRNILGRNAERVLGLSPGI